MDTRDSPRRLLGSHPANQLPDLTLGGRSSKPTRFPMPERLEAGPMPANDGLRFYDDQRVSPLRPQAPKRDPEDPVYESQSGARPLRLEHRELLT